MLARARSGVLGPEAIDARDPEIRAGLDAALERLDDKGLVDLLITDRATVDGDEPLARLTNDGMVLLADLTEARCEALTELVADWEPESPEVDEMIDALARELGGREPAPTR